MKMKKYYPVLKSRAELWDMARMFTTAEERCGWIDDCSANDNAFTAACMYAKPYGCCYLVKQLTFNDMSKCNL